MSVKSERFWALIGLMITIEEIIKTYAGNIRRVRQNKKVTQAVMADKIGITEKNWSVIETRRKPCSLDTLLLLQMLWRLNHMNFCYQKAKS